jgi:uncharacterized damage-inducible protein DinB
LPDAQLDFVIAGAGRSLRETLVHLIDGQRSFVARLGGSAQPPDGQVTAWPGFDALDETARTTDEALIAAADSLDEDADVTLGWAGKRYRYPSGFFLLHAIQHGTAHRTEIMLALAQMDIAHPDLDAWSYAPVAGFGAEA